MVRFLLLISLLLTFSVNAAWDQHKETIVEVAVVTNVEPELITAVALLESSFRQDAKAAAGSSKGIMGITDPTWKHLVTKYGEEYEVKHSDRMKPRAELIMGAMYLSDIKTYLETRYKRKATYTEIYLGYKFGPQRALEMLSLNKTTKLVDFYPEAAERNKSVYFKENTPRTVAETARVFKNRIRAGLNQFGQEAKRLFEEKQEEAFAVYRDALNNSDCVRLFETILPYRCHLDLLPVPHKFTTPDYLVSGRKHNHHFV